MVANAPPPTRRAPVSLWIALSSLLPANTSTAAKRLPPSDARPAGRRRWRAPARAVRCRTGAGIAIDWTDPAASSTPGRMENAGCIVPAGVWYGQASGRLRDPNRRGFPAGPRIGAWIHRAGARRGEHLQSAADRRGSQLWDSVRRAKRHSRGGVHALVSLAANTRRVSMFAHATPEGRDLDSGGAIQGVLVLRDRELESRIASANFSRRARSARLLGAIRTGRWAALEAAARFRPTPGAFRAFVSLGWEKPAILL